MRDEEDWRDWHHLQFNHLKDDIRELLRLDPNATGFCPSNRCDDWLSARSQHAGKDDYLLADQFAEAQSIHLAATVSRLWSVVHCRDEINCFRKVRTQRWSHTESTPYKRFEERVFGTAFSPVCAGPIRWTSHLLIRLTLFPQMAFDQLKKIADGKLWNRLIHVHGDPHDLFYLQHAELAEPVIYHYTDVAGLKGIIESNTLWASAAFVSQRFV